MGRENYLDGAISEVATRRSEFAAILKNDGIDGLIRALNRKADMLTGTSAKAFQCWKPESWFPIVGTLSEIASSLRSSP